MSLFSAAVPRDQNVAGESLGCGRRDDQNWSAGVEYDHMFMGTQANNFVTPAGIAAGADNIKQDVDLFTARVNYKFGGPIVARY